MESFLYVFLALQTLSVVLAQTPSYIASFTSNGQFCYVISNTRSSTITTVEPTSTSTAVPTTSESASTATEVSVTTSASTATEETTTAEGITTTTATTISTEEPTTTTSTTEESTTTTSTTTEEPTTTTTSTTTEEPTTTTTSTTTEEPTTTTTSTTTEEPTTTTTSTTTEQVTTTTTTTSSVPVCTGFSLRVTSGQLSNQYAVNVGGNVRFTPNLADATRYQIVNDDELHAVSTSVQIWTSNAPFAYISTKTRVEVAGTMDILSCMTSDPDGQTDLGILSCSRAGGSSTLQICPGMSALVLGRGFLEPRCTAIILRASAFDCVD